MRKWLTVTCALVAVLIAGSAAEQETRGTISGTVRDKDGVLPGANVTITNTGTSISQQLVTNVSGHFEAPLLVSQS
jgi:carboxypeptidase family protein